MALMITKLNQLIDMIVQFWFIRLFGFSPQILRFGAQKKRIVKVTDAQM